MRTLLPSETLHSLHATAITAGLDRDALLKGIDKRFLASLPQSSSRAAQLLVDIHELAVVEKLVDGTVPLRTWLTNAVGMTAGHPRQEVFLAALRVLDPEAARWAAAEQGDAGPAPAEAPQEPKVRLYISAARSDIELVRRLRTHLSSLARNMGVEVWDRSQMLAGASVSDVEKRLAAAQVVLLLVSPEYLASAETLGEAEKALARRASGARVVPVLARPCDWSSSLLAGLTILPRTGRAITSHSDPDAAFTTIARELGAVVEDASRAQAGAPRGADGAAPSQAGDAGGPKASAGASSPGASTAGPGATAVGPGASAAAPGTLLSLVFKRNGSPDFVYVEPAQARRIRAALRDRGRGLVIEGPSKIGKTTVLRKELGTARHEWLDAYSNEEEIERRIEERKLDGTLVLDNAHALPAETLKRLARWLRVEADEGAPRGKLVVIGIRGLVRRLTGFQRDLGGRVDQISMAKQPEAKIRELVDLGERVGRLRFEHKAAIVKASLGSFQLAHMLCFECAAAQGLDAVPAEETSVTKDIAEVRAQVKKELENQLDDPVLAFVRADAGTATPGAGLAYLRMLATSDAETEKLAFTTLRREYPLLEPAWAFWERGGHETAKGGEESGSGARFDLREVAQVVAGSLESDDPLLRFYLRELDWNELAERAGITVEWEDATQKLLIVTGTARPAAGAAPDRRRGLYEEKAYPSWHPGAVTLRDLLVGAYPRVEQIERLAREAGVDLGLWSRGGGASQPAWDSLLEVAAKQAKLEALMKRVLADDNVRAYHKEIRATLTSLGVPEAQA